MAHGREMGERARNESRSQERKEMGREAVSEFLLFADDANIFFSSSDPKELEITVNAELNKVKKLV